MEDKKLIKQAGHAIRQLIQEKEDIEQELDNRKEATKLAFDLYEKGSISHEDLSSAIEDLSSKDNEELELIKKASELNNQSQLFSTFKVSDSPILSTELDNPLNQMLIEDL